MTQVVKHKSRLITEDFQFTANGQLNWSFIAEGDGEIYLVESNNVASYTINGSAPSLPYSVVNGQSYTVAITKTTGGQVADIQLKIRRAVDKNNIINVPDFTAGDGRYMYVLFEGANEVKKIDTDLLTTANYLGGGSWTSNPVVSTISLPVLPNSSTYKSITFVKNGGVGKMFLQGGTSAGNLEVYASYILSDDSVVDMDLGTATPYTLIHTGNLKAVTGNCVYDFIQEKLYIALTSIGNGNTTLTYDLINRTHTEGGLSDNSTSAVSSTLIRSVQFIPELSRFSYLADIDLDTDRYFNYKPAKNAGSRSSYASSLGYTERNNGLIKSKVFLDSFGVKQAVFSCGDSPVGGAPSNLYNLTDVITLDSIGAVFSIYLESYSVVNYKGGNGTASDVVDFEVGASRLKSPMGSNYSGQYYALSSNTTSKRLFVFDLAEDPHMFGYVEFVNDASQMHTNQLII